MQDLQAAGAALYNRLILRDLFGKIVPGSIFLFAVALTFLPPYRILAELAGQGILIDLLLLGAAWISAFVLQAAGESVGALLNHPEGLTRDAFYQELARFDDASSEHQRMHGERLLVIKEACGNAGMALLLSFLVNGLASVALCAWPGPDSPPWSSIFTPRWWILGALALFAGLLLVRWHREHVDRHRSYVQNFIQHRAAHPVPK